MRLCEVAVLHPGRTPSSKSSSSSAPWSSSSPLTLADRSTDAAAGISATAISWSTSSDPPGHAGALVVPRSAEHLVEKSFALVVEPRPRAVLRTGENPSSDIVIRVDDLGHVVDRLLNPETDHAHWVNPNQRLARIAGRNQFAHSADLDHPRLPRVNGFKIVNDERNLSVGFDVLVLS